MVGARKRYWARITSFSKTSAGAGWILGPHLHKHESSLGALHSIFERIAAFDDALNVDITEFQTVLLPGFMVPNHALGEGSAT